MALVASEAAAETAGCRDWLALMMQLRGAEGAGRPDKRMGMMSIVVVLTSWLAFAAERPL